MMYLMKHGLDGNVKDYLKFKTIQAAWNYIQSMLLDYDRQPSYSFTLSTEAINVDESEYKLTN